MKIAIVGATGMVGKTIVKILSENNLSFDSLDLYSRYEYPITFGDKVLYTKPLNTDKLVEADLIFSAAGSNVSKEIYPKLTSKNWIIDKTSAFRMMEEIPLVVPEINMHEVDKMATAEKKIIACPNCVAIPLSLSLMPFNQIGKIQHCFVSTYQSVSGAGRGAMTGLSREQKNDQIENEEKIPQYFQKVIANNVIPHIDTMSDDLWTGEEIKICQETDKILGQQLNIDITCVRVPITIGHSASVHLIMDKPVDLDKLTRAFEEAEGVFLIEGVDRYLTSLEIVGSDACFVSRLRIHRNKPNCVSFWLVCDNLRKGAAYNAFQIGEYIAEKFIR